MTVQERVRTAARTVADSVREMFPHYRDRSTFHERQLGIFLRGNKDLYEALTGIIQSRIEGRANLPEPSDPLQCKSMMARDRECQSILSRLSLIYRSPAPQPAEEGGEPPA